MTSFAPSRTAWLTGLAMVAFAANSVLARMALRTEVIDASSFTTLRLASGALALFLITAGRRRRPVRDAISRGTNAHRDYDPSTSSHTGGTPRSSGSWLGALMLFLYAGPFSFAYLGLSTATGALILFGLVQVTMIVGGLVLGERPGRIQWLGLLMAIGGLVYLMSPGLTAPPPLSAALMALAGFAWGVYSLLGRESAQPLMETSGNFARSVLFVALLSLISFSQLHIRLEGVLLACASGALASGVGYAVWYAALPGLTATRAAVVQLSVPILAAAGGSLLLSEAVTVRLLLSGALTLGGIALAVVGRAQGER